jgi:hypothetical protein
LRIEHRRRLGSRFPVAMVVAGIGEEEGKHQGASAHAWGDSAQPEVACVVLATCAAATTGGCTAVAALPVACEAGNGCERQL